MLYFSQEDINQRNICAKFEMSIRGDFGAAVMMCKFCIEIHGYIL